MKRIALLLILIFVGLYLNAQEFSCSRMSDNWESDDEAIRRIENTIFKSSESVRPDKNSWMTSAYYYSCDDEFGYLIVKGTNKTSIHENVPIAKWNSLKEASSIGEFYNFYQKNIYELEMNKTKSLIL